MSRMDTRRDPRSRERQDSPRDVSTDTVPVELVDLQSVGKASAGSKRGTLVLLAIVGILAVAAIGSALQAPSPAPSPSVPAVALGSPSPSPSASGPATPRSTPRPTPRPTPIVTPAPTPVPTYPWTWTRSELPTQEDQNFFGPFAVGDGFLGLWSTWVNDRDLWQAAPIPPADPETWGFVQVPAVLNRLWGSFVYEERLWALARVTGVNAEQTSWQMVSTTTGDSWESLGPAQGLPGIASARIVGRAGTSWVVDGSFRLEGEGFVPTALLWSGDGIHWNPATVPSTEPLGYGNAGALGDTLLMLASTQHQDGANSYYVLTSSDGSTWKKSAPNVPDGAYPTELECGPAFCVISLDAYDQPPGTTRQVMVSTDGAHWSVVDLELPMAPQGEGIRVLRATPTGVLAMAGGSGYAVLTSDGRGWQAVEVMPADQVLQVWNVAIKGDVVLAYARQEDAESGLSQVLLQGSLARMAASD